MDVPDTPTLSNLVVSAAVFIGTSVGAAVLYYKSKLMPAKPEMSPHDMVVSAATIADMGPVREVVAQMKRIADSIEKITQRMEQTAEDAVIEREVQNRLRRRQNRQI